MRLGELFLWEGVVEDRNDPLMLGRCRVRIFGLHTADKQLLPTADLPWSLPIQPITSAANSGIGQTPLGPIEGTTVVGYFRDGKDRQQFAIIGTIAGIPELAADSSQGFNDPNGNYPRVPGESDVNSLARGDSGEAIDRHNDALVRDIPIAGGWGTWSEPSLTYSAEYPFDHVRETESGHVEEFDDTPKAERIHRRHRTGSGYEMMPDGSVAERIVKDKYEVIVGDDYLYVKGNCNLSVSGNVNIYSARSINIDAIQDIRLNALGKIIMQAGEDIVLYTGASLKQAAADAIQLQSGADTTLFAGGNILTKGAQTRLQSAMAQNPGITKPISSQPTETVQNEITAQTEAFLISIEGESAPIDADFSDDVGISISIFSEGQTVATATTDGESTITTITKTDQTPAPIGSIVVPTTCPIIEYPIDYNMQLTARFKLKDLTNDCVFKHWIPEDGWEGLSADEIICNLQGLATNILEPLADQYPGFRVNCAFRKQTGNSQHRFGMACDIQYPSKTVEYEFEVAQWAKDNLPFDQLIFEHGSSAWLHFSYNRNGSRKDMSRVLSYKEDGWGTGKQYTTGLVLALPSNVRVSPGGRTFV